MQLLQGGYFEILREFSGKKAEHQHGQEGVLALRMVDYVQSVIAATPPKSGGYIDLDEGSWSILVSSVSKLFELFLPFFICQTSHRKQTGRAHDHRLEALFTQLEMIWVLVRGDRHGAHHIPHMADLLAPHEAAINDVYGVRVADITAGLGRIRENLGRGIHDAISALHRMDFEFEGMAGVNQVRRRTS